MCKLLVPYLSPLGLAGMQEFRVHVGLDLVVFVWFRAPERPQTFFGEAEGRLGGLPGLPGSAFSEIP